MILLMVTFQWMKYKNMSLIFYVMKYLDDVSIINYVSEFNLQAYLCSTNFRTLPLVANMQNKR